MMILERMAGKHNIQIIISLSKDREHRRLKAYRGSVLCVNCLI